MEHWQWQQKELNSATTRSTSRSRDFTNRHLHIGNVDIDFITFLCYQHYCRIFKGKDEQKLESNRDDKIFLSLSIVGLLWDILDWFYFLSYRVSLKKRYFLGFCLISLLEVRFYFFTCVSESEFRARFI